MNTYGRKLCDALGALVECVRTTLDDAGRSVCWLGLYPAEEQPADYCDACGDEMCGMAWVRVVTAYPSEVFPQPTIDATCRVGLAYMLEAGVTRCMPTVETDGGLPGDEDLTTAAFHSLDDMILLYQAITCCDDGFTKLAIEAWTPTGPEGGCGGGFWTFYVAVE